MAKMQCSLVQKREEKCMYNLLHLNGAPPVHHPHPPTIIALTLLPLINESAPLRMNLINTEIVRKNSVPLVSSIYRTEEWSKCNAV
jgi:hypothetical protein